MGFGILHAHLTVIHRHRLPRRPPVLRLDCNARATGHIYRYVLVSRPAAPAVSNRVHSSLMRRTATMDDPVSARTRTCTILQTAWRFPVTFHQLYFSLYPDSQPSIFSFPNQKKTKTNHLTNYTNSHNQNLAEFPSCTTLPMDVHVVGTHCQRAFRPELTLADTIIIRQHTPVNF